MKKVICIWIICLILLNMTACSGGSNQVPDMVVEQSLISSGKLEEYDIDSWTTTHDVDDASHTDTVAIKLVQQSAYGNLTVQGIGVYQYDRASDLWNQVRIGSWSKPTYEFNSKLVKQWNIKTGDTESVIKITKAIGNRITVKCSSVTVEDRFFAGVVSRKWEGEGTFTVDESGDIAVPMTADDGEKKNLYISLSLDAGIESAVIYYYSH